MPPRRGHHNFRDETRTGDGSRVLRPSMRELFEIPFSPWSEKARWALELNGLAFTDRRLLPGPHVLTVKRRAAKTTVPVLEHDDVVVQGSSAILDYLEAKLGAKKLAPPAEHAARSAEVEARADLAFGLGTQRIFYATLLDHPSEVIRMWSQAGPFWGRAFLKVVLPLSLPGVFAGSLLTFIPASGDFINAELLGSPNQQMIGTVIQNQFLEVRDYSLASAVSFVLMVVITIGVFAYARALGTEELA